MKNNLDSSDSLKTHYKIIRKNKFLYKIYCNFYDRIAFYIVNGPIVEIGSGAGFIKKIIPNTITTDVISGKGIDKIIYAEKLPFKKSSLGTIVMLNVFHHIKNPVSALEEFQRCLKPNGRIVMIEPWPTIFSTFIYKNFHHEEFNLKSKWEIKGDGRMSDANGALPWIIFKRDIKKLKRLFPNLSVEIIEPHTPFKYLVSGNLSKPQLLPVSFYPFIDYIERILSPLKNFLSLFATIVITKANTHTKRD